MLKDDSQVLESRRAALKPGIAVPRSDFLGWTSHIPSPIIDL
jgi:hypothetical protein